MIDTAQLREALDNAVIRDRRDDLWSSRREVTSGLILNAARELLTLREAGALIITPDEDGKWPDWALVAVLTDRPIGVGNWVYEAVERLDDIRDAKPDGSGE